jgi:hypothetical protein
MPIVTSFRNHFGVSKGNGRRSIRFVYATVLFARQLGISRISVYRLLGDWCCASYWHLYLPDIRYRWTSRPGSRPRGHTINPGRRFLPSCGGRLFGASCSTKARQGLTGWPRPNISSLLSTIQPTNRELPVLRKACRFSAFDALVPRQPTRNHNCTVAPIVLGWHIIIPKSGRPSRLQHKDQQHIGIFANSSDFFASMEHRLEMSLATTTKSDSIGSQKHHSSDQASQKAPFGARRDNAGRPRAKGGPPASG